MHRRGVLHGRLCAGEPVYPEERERILGQKARRTRRLAARAARRSKVSP